MAWPASCCAVPVCACATAWRDTDSPDAVRCYNGVAGRRCTTVGLPFQLPAPHHLCRTSTSTFGDGNGRDPGQQPRNEGCQFGGDCMALAERGLEGCSRSRVPAFADRPWPATLFERCAAGSVVPNTWPGPTWPGQQVVSPWPRRDAWHPIRCLAMSISILLWWEQATRIGETASIRAELELFHNVIPQRCSSLPVVSASHA